MTLLALCGLIASGAVAMAGVLRIAIWYTNQFSGDDE
jgi:hypothetical protein